MATLRQRLTHLERKAAQATETRNDPQRAALKALVKDLPQPVLRILAGEEVDLEAEINRLIGIGDAETARIITGMVLDLANDGDLVALLVPQVLQNQREEKSNDTNTRA